MPHSGAPFAKTRLRQDLDGGPVLVQYVARKVSTYDSHGRDPERRGAGAGRMAMGTMAAPETALIDAGLGHGVARKARHNRAERSQQNPARLAFGLHFEPAQLLARHAQHALGIGIWIAGFPDIDHQRIGFDRAG